MGFSIIKLGKGKGKVGGGEGVGVGLVLLAGGQWPVAGKNTVPRFPQQMYPGP